MRIMHLLMGFIAAASLSSAALAAPPYLDPDSSWITLSGEVASTADESFTLDYGDGSVTVTMEDWDWYDNNGAVLEDDNVTVYGKVNDETYEKTTIDASSIFVEGLGTYFYASAEDEESFEDIDIAPSVPVVVGALSVTGTVTEVDGREFKIDSGLREVTVDTSSMDYNPMDESRFQTLEEGDLVTVTGDINTGVGIFSNRKLMAEHVMTLSDESAN